MQVLEHRRLFKITLSDTCGNRRLQHSQTRNFWESLYKMVSPLEVLMTAHTAVLMHMRYYIYIVVIFRMGEGG